MTITEIVLTESEFRTLIATLDKGISVLDQEEQGAKDFRQEGISLTGVLKKMAMADATYVIQCKTTSLP